MPKGGPDGGNGGDGGDVIVRVGDCASLLDYHHQRKYRASDGQAGGANERTGARGQSVVLHVPKGTLVYIWDGERKTLLADLEGSEQEVLVAKGGRGGRGNAFFKSSTHQTPRLAQPGEPSEVRELYLELRLLADVGLIGLPNAGKSSLLRKISRATPKVADYPFTTLVPHLGIVRIFGKDWIFGDLPGLVSGAASGVGLGHRFLKHVERTRCLLVLLDGDPMVAPPTEQLAILLRELSAYNPDLLQKPRLVVVNKSDLMDKDCRRLLSTALARVGAPFVRFVSTVSSEGISDLLQDVFQTRVAKGGVLASAGTM